MPRTGAHINTKSSKKILSQHHILLSFYTVPYYNTISIIGHSGPADMELYLSVEDRLLVCSFISADAALACVR